MRYSSLNFNNMHDMHVGVNNDSNVTVRRRRRIIKKTPVPDMTVRTGGSAGRRRLSTELDIVYCLLFIVYCLLFNV